MADRLQRELIELLTWAKGQPEILAVYLFGSQANGMANPLSDVDISLLMIPGLPRQQLWEWELEWSSRWSEGIDLRILNLGSLVFQYEVTANGKRLWAAELGVVAEIESLIWRRYWDLQPKLEEYWRGYLQHLMEKRNAAEREQYQAALEQVRTVHRRVREAAKDAISGVQGGPHLPTRR